MTGRGASNVVRGGHFSTMNVAGRRGGDRIRRNVKLAIFVVLRKKKDCLFRGQHIKPRSVGTEKADSGGKRKRNPVVASSN